MEPCKAGGVLIAAGDQHDWPRVCSALGKPEWQTDPRFTTRHERSKHAAAVNDAMRALMSTMTMKDAFAPFPPHTAFAPPVNTTPQRPLAAHPWERRATVGVRD